MPRIPVKRAADGGPVLKLFYRIAGKRYGAVPEPMAVVAHHRGLLRTSIVHELMAEKASKHL